MELQEMRPTQRRFLEENLKIEGLQPYGLPLINSLKAWEYIHTHNEITLVRILELHRITMDGLMDNPGVFRKKAVWLRKSMPNPYWFPGSDAPLISYRYEPTVKAKLVLPYINRWLKKGDFSFLVSHYLFESIHPFLDGNGRVGRFLWAWGILLNGGSVHPILKYFDTDPEDDFDFVEARSRYYNAIQEFRDANIPKEDLHAGKIRSGSKRTALKPSKRRSSADARDAETRVRPGKDRV